MDKPKKAVAIKYDKTRDRAPRVVAKGKGTIAQKIIDVAQMNDVPV